MRKRSSGEGTIVMRADGRWAGAISLPDGRRKWCYGKTQQEVARKLAAVRRDRDSGLPVSSDRRTVEDYLESWLEMRKPSLRPGAHDNYTWYCRTYIIPTIGQVPLSKLTGEHVQRLLSTRLSEGLAPSTVRYAHAVLRNALNEAAALGLVPRNVALLVKKPRAPRIEMRCWDPEQARKFLEAARDDRLYALYVVALSTGMREGELLALRWRDVTLPVSGEGSLRVQHTLHWRDGTLSIEEVKTETGRRQIHLSARATEALRRHRLQQLEERAKCGAFWRDNDLVFCTTTGGAIHVSNFRRRSFLRIVRAAGVPYIRPYDMRHTAATFLLLAGIHPTVVSEMLGHSSVTIALTIYSHVLPMLQRDAASAMDRLLGGEDRSTERRVEVRRGRFPTRRTAAEASHAICRAANRANREQRVTQWSALVSPSRHTVVVVVGTRALHHFRSSRSWQHPRTTLPPSSSPFTARPGSSATAPSPSKTSGRRSMPHGRR